MKKKLKPMFDIPRKYIYIFGYILSLVLVILGLVPDLLPDFVKNTLVFANGIILVTITWIYQNIEKRLDEFESIIDKESKVDCRLLQPTSSVNGEITVEKLALGCSRMILLMYFGQRAPSEFYKDQTKRIFDYVKRNKNLFCNNIILASPSTIDWIKWQTEYMENENNFNLSCYIEVKDVSVYHLGISSLVFDDNRVLLIDPGKRHGVVATERDILFESQKVNEMFCSYHNNLFSKGIPILIQGKIEKNNFDNLFAQFNKKKSQNLAKKPVEKI